MDICRECRYWHRCGADLGHCRRWPPLGVDVGVQGRKRQPRTRDTDTCGEFDVRDEAPEPVQLETASRPKEPVWPWVIGSVISFGLAVQVGSIVTDPEWMSYPSEFRSAVFVAGAFLLTLGAFHAGLAAAYTVQGKENR